MFASPLVVVIISTSLLCVLATTVSNNFNDGNNSNLNGGNISSIATNGTPTSVIPSTVISSEPFSLSPEPNSDENDAAGDESGEEYPLSKNVDDEPETLGAAKAGPFYGSCYLELNTTGELAKNCLKNTNTDGSISDVFLPPDQVKPADIGMYCSIWIRAKKCEIKTTCEKCPNEGALAEHFLKDSARERYDKYCHNTSIKFDPLEKPLCEVTPSSKTGLIITVVVLAFVIVGLCAFICFFVPVSGKGKKKGGAGGDKSSSSKAKQAASGSGGGAAVAGAKTKPSKVK